MNKQVYRLLVMLSILSILLAGSAAPASAAPWQSKVDPWVLQTAGEGETEFLVYLTAQADLSAASALSTKLEKGTYVFNTLTSFAERTQKPILSELERLGVDHRTYWIANMIWVRGGSSTIQLLAQRLDVAHLYANPQVALEAPAMDNSTDLQPAGIEWNITWVNADQVWNLGYTGQGAVVGGQDTGYDWDHPALINQYRGWDGASADHDYNWHDAIHENNPNTPPGNPCGFDSPVPCDDESHGTHTMGTMVGDDGGANQIGMAPGARWIGCRNMEEGWGTPSTYTECYEWFIAPTRVDGSEPRPDLAPDVINNSWGCPPSEGCNPDSLLIPVQNLVAAGIVTAHSAGNSGSGCGSVNPPAAIYDESFTVGATGDHSNTIAGYSSRGPVTVDGSNRSKPDISAPGSNIRSSVPGTGYQGGWSGTSMAGPHVAGLVALLISAQPSLSGQVSQIEATIEQSALGLTTTQGCGGDLPDEIPNNVYGWGRIDALAAVESLHQLDLVKVASAPVVFLGDLITYTLTITNLDTISPTTHVVLTDTIPTGSTFVSASLPYTQTGDVIGWEFPSLAPMGSVNVNLVVRADFTLPGSITNEDYAVHSDQAAMVYGEPVTTLVEKLDFLQLNKTASAPMVFPGDLITYTLEVTSTLETNPTTHVVLMDTIPVGTSFVSASLPYTQIGDTIRWDFSSLAAMGTISVDLVVRVEMTSAGTLTNQDYSVQSDQAVPVPGAPVSTSLGSLAFIPVMFKSP